MNNMHLYLIRHGQSYVNLPDWNSGNVDEGLTELGQQQAAALAAWLPEKLPKVDAIYASTMKRARETAAPLAVAYNHSVQWDDRLREIGNNRLDHTAWPADSLPQKYADYWGSERPFASITPALDGGESLMHVRIRVGMFIEEMVQQYPAQTVLAICHGGVIEMVYDHVFNIGPWRRCEIWTHNTGVTHFEYVAHPTRETWRLHSHSRTEHLVGLKRP